MAYQLYQLFPRDIARHIHFSINPTPAQRRGRDLEAHKKEYYLSLETISLMGELYRMDPDPEEMEDYEDLSFIAWWWQDFGYAVYGVGLLRQYLAQCEALGAARDAAHAEAARELAEAREEEVERLLWHLPLAPLLHQLTPQMGNKLRVNR
jgi:hypothetical protein